MKPYKLGLFTATSVVIANMIGTGVFTSLGFQAAGLETGSAIMMLWVLGAIMALSGAFCYAEIGAALPRSGGEYHYLSHLIHPSVGFAAGWVSITVGFAAPVAAACMAFGKYLNNIFPTVSETGAALIILLALSMIHSISLRAGGKVQDFSTGIKLTVMAVFIASGLLMNDRGAFDFSFSESFNQDLLKADFATSFFFVTLAYSGWNAAGYFASDLENPSKQLPKALLGGTIIVALLYCGINYVFLKSTPLAEMSNADGPVVEIAAVAASNIFGNKMGILMGGIIAILLVSTINAMVLAGPRVSMAMGQDHRIFAFFAKMNHGGVPARAIMTQGVISAAFIISATFSQVIIYISFTLSLFTFLTVAAGLIYRLRKSNAGSPAFLAPLFPLPHLLFLSINGWLLFYGFKANPDESILGLLTALAGMLIWAFSKRFLPASA